MYEYIKGEITTITPTYLVVENAGIGYRTNISLNTFTAFQSKKKVQVFIHQVIKEDSNALYGFSQLAERSLFLLLTTVSGVGAATALIMLSSLSIGEIKEAIATGDALVLQSVKGIGTKTAQRIIIELKDKVLKLEGDVYDQKTVAGTSNGDKDEAVAALVMLGFKKNLVEKAVAKVLKTTPDAVVEEIIKLSLKQL